MNAEPSTKVETGTSPGLDALDRIWRRHGRTFWALHSVWALATGVLVLWLAHERYDFVYWVVGFLVLTWASTLYFGRRRDDPGDVAFRTRFGRGLASYLTRVLYQETLFFLLPFYAYSAVIPSWNLGFLALLGVLAVLACLDLVFDRWLRESPVFSLVFFTSVTFGVLNLLIPMLFGTAPAAAAPLAAVASLLVAMPIVARQPHRSRGTTLRLGLAAIVILGVAAFGRPLIPPVPLRIQEVVFAADLDRETLEPQREIGNVAASDALGGRIVVLARIFAPANVHARISLDWYRDGVLLRSAREVEIVAHEGGFRVWDALQDDGGELPAGGYRVVLRTADHRVFGSAEVELR